MQEYLDTIKVDVLNFVSFMISVVAFAQILFITIKIGQINILEQLSNLNMLQTEYQAVLGSLNEAIISINDSKLKYFNKRGKNILEQSLVDEQNDQKKKMESQLTTVEANIENKKLKWDSSEESQQLQQIILDKKIFRPYFKEISDTDLNELDEAVNSISMTEILKSNSDLDTMVFQLES